MLSGGKDHSVRLWDVEGEGELSIAVESVDITRGVWKRWPGWMGALVMEGGLEAALSVGGWDQRLLLWDALQQQRQRLTEEGRGGAQ